VLAVGVVEVVSILQTMMVCPVARGAGLVAPQLELLPEGLEIHLLFHLHKEIMAEALTVVLPALILFPVGVAVLVLMVGMAQLAQRRLATVA
jgi:CHASE1-domain containing sensor protein